ncbi:stress-activated map kinase-interacting protein-like protein [Amylocarpus encephaloides]|uniref:Stress-activated map kinase-interacting protein-like protein n=1 Tax=Amylocarpus encephaloides TaxID=45428 RepID=A0A9P8C586_9HELO|nr:stress-activated map kinase-interacting protein-like protein [Amylocarpus encephaloides]
MSVIQVEDLVSYQLRTNYLNTIADGVGERLITINDAFLNTAGFKAAGWRQNLANIKRTHSPPIPTAITSEYFQAPPRSAGLAGLDDEVEEGGMVTGGRAGDTVGPGIAIKRRRRREQMEEEDSSDLSDDSEEESDQRAAQQIKFSKMPIRNRSGSSPIRGSNLRQTSTITSPVRAAPAQARRGSQPAVDAVKERARRDTVTSSEMSSENEFDASAFQRTREAARNAAKASRALHSQTSDPNVGIKRQQSDLLEEEEEDSDGSDMDSEFEGSIDSTSMLDSVAGAVLPPSPGDHIVGTVPKDLTRSPTKKSKPAPPVLQALPPPRPISMIQPKSLLSAAIKARKTKAATPFESFASLSGQGDPNPLSLRIWAPFATSTTKPYEVLIRRSVHENEANDRQVAVADLIGLSLWRYAEEKIEPVVSSEKLNVNWWTLRMVEDEEVDYDFPALERTKALVSFTTANNRAARARSNTKPYDEFALVQATAEQFQENQKVTPQFKREIVASSTPGIEDDLTPRNSPMSTPSTLVGTLRQNPLLASMTALRQNNPLADAPAIGGAPLQPARPAVRKLLRIHIHSADAAPGQMITLDVTNDTYLADILDIVCKRRQLDKANHVLKLTGSGTVVLLDRRVDSIGNREDLDLYRRRFATDGPLTMSGSPSSSSSPKLPLMFDRPDFRKVRKGQMLGTHPLAQEAIKQDELGNSNYRKYTVWRKQPMRFVGMNERVLAIDGEYLHIMPASTGKTMFEGQGKTTTVHFSNVVGCKVTRRHPTNFKVVVYKATETKRYDFEGKSADEAAEIVFEIKKGISPYHNV